MAENSRGLINELLDQDTLLKQANLFISTINKIDAEMTKLAEKAITIHLQVKKSKDFDALISSMKSYQQLSNEVEQKEKERAAVVQQVSKNNEALSKSTKDLADLINEENGRLNENVKAYEQQQMRLEKLKIEKKGLVDNEKELNSSYKNGRITQEAYTKSIDQNNEKIRQNTKEQKDAKSQISGLDTIIKQQNVSLNASYKSMEGISAQLGLLRSNYRKLSEEERNSPMGKEMLANIQNLDKEIKTLDSSIGNNQRNVGNYSSVIKALPGPIGQFAKGLVDAKNGVLAVTKASLAFIATPVGMIIAAIAAALAALSAWFNRTAEGQEALAKGTAYFNSILESILDMISGLGELIYKAFTSPKEAVDALKKSFGEVGDVLSAIYGAVELIINGQISVGVTLLNTTLKKVFEGVIDKAEKSVELEERTRDLMERRVDSQKKIYEWQAKINELTEVARNQENSIEERQKALNKLKSLEGAIYKENNAMAKEDYLIRKETNALHDTNFDQLLEEKKLNAELSKTTTDYAAKLKALARIQNTIRNQDVTNRHNLTKEELEVEIKLEEDALKEIVNMRKQHLEDAFGEGRIKALEELNAAEIELIDAQAKNRIDLAKAEHDRLVEQKALEGEQLTRAEETLRKEIIAIEKEAANSRMGINTAAEKDIINELINIREQGLEDLNQLNKEARVKEEKDLADKLISRKITQEKYDKELSDISFKYAKKELENTIKVNEQILENSGLTEEQKYEIKKKLTDARIALSEQETREDIKNFDEQAEARKANFEAVKNLAIEAFDMTMDFLTQQSEARIAALDAELQKIEEIREADLQRIEEGLMSEETRAAAIKNINDKADADRKKIEAEKRKEQVKQAAYQKAQAIAQALINTALAVSAMLSAQPAGVWNIPLAIAAGVLGAAQVAIIAAQKLPAYKHGTDYHPGGPALTGDGGVKEYILTKQGDFYETPQTPTILDIPRGARVFPNMDAFMRSMDAMRPNIDYLELPQKDNEKYQFDKMRKDIVGAINNNKASLSVNLDQRGIYHVSKQKGGKNRSVNQISK